MGVHHFWTNTCICITCIYIYIHICMYIYIYTHNHPKVDRTWDFQHTFPIFTSWGHDLGTTRPERHPPGGTPGWNALWSLRPTSRCGWWTARGPGRSTAAAVWRRRTARMDRWGWGWMGKFEQLGQFFRKNNLKIIFFGEIIWKIQMFLFFGNMGWGGKP